MDTKIHFGQSTDFQNFPKNRFSRARWWNAQGPLKERSGQKSYLNLNRFPQEIEKSPSAEGVENEQLSTRRVHLSQKKPRTLVG